MIIESLLLSAGYDLAKEGLLKFKELFSQDGVGFKNIEDFKEYDKNIYEKNINSQLLYLTL